MLQIVQRRNAADHIAEGGVRGHVAHALATDPNLGGMIFETLDELVAGAGGH